MASKTGRIDALVMGLARGLTVRSAAKLAGFSERQAHRRAAEPATKAKVNAVRAGLVHRATGILSAACADAAKVLHTLAASAESEGVRLAAAKAILETTLRLRESTEIVERLELLEIRVSANRNGTNHVQATN